MPPRASGEISDVLTVIRVSGPLILPLCAVQVCTFTMMYLKQKPKKKQERKGKAELLEKKPVYKQFLYGFLNLIRFDYRI